ncbi:MAG: sensor histidine kinase [Clostridia bacterium]
MIEHKMIRTHLLKSMILNLILFTIVFGTFSIFILSQFNQYLYTSVDKEIYQYKDNLERKTKSEREKINNIFPRELLTEEELIQEVQSNINAIENPRIVTILRDGDGDVIATSLSVKYFAEYIDKTEWKSVDTNQIYEIKVNSGSSNYFYRGTTCDLTASDGEKYYMDIMVNINSEKQMSVNFTKTLSVGTIIVIVLSIIISWFLSKKTVAPIVKSYQKQTEFVQNASHELRTPLTIIQAKQELLLQSPESKIIDKSEDIALTLNETRRLSKMISELMELARADNDKTVIHKTKTNIEELATELIIPYQEMAEIQNKKMKLTVNCNREINLDKNKIKQLMIILLDNALKYTEENDSIEVEIYNRDDKLFLNIKDTGIGISDEGIKHIFERFYREDKARSREKGGTGLGLSIAHTIVKKHGGTIKLVHNKPKGTIVIVKI